MCSRYEDFEEMEISSFDIQQILNSLDDYKDDSDLDIKPFASENIPISQSVNKWIQNTNNFKCEAESNHQLPTVKASSSRLISFGSPSSPLETDKLSEVEDDVVYNNDANTTARDPLQAQYHVVAERRRREKLTQLFISLSKILPGLKKLDKASLLDHAIKHMKKLQERLRVLEEEANTTSNALDSPERMYFTVEDPPASDIGTRNPIHEIKVKISSSTMLIKLLCDKEHRLVQKILEELGKLHLIVSDFRVIPFGCNTLDVTILVQIDTEFSCTVKDVTTQLETAFLYPHDMGNKSIK